MPSGSHGGGGGSHFSGGSSHFGGSGRGSQRPHRPINFVFLGHRYYYSSSKAGNLVNMLSALVFMIIFTVMWGFGLVMISKNISTIKAQRTYYLNMIEYAENNTELLVNGTISDKFYNEDAGKWYLTYKIDMATGGKLDGYTFSIYDDNEINAFHIGDTILLAVNYVPIDSLTDSVNVDYKDKALEDDGEYVNAKSDVFMMGAVVGVLVIIIVVLAVKTIKTLKQGKDATVKEDANEIVDRDFAPNQTKAIPRCTYCGSALKEDETKCPNCGATRK